MNKLNSDVLKNQVLCFVENDDNSQYFDKWIADKDLSNAKVLVTQNTLSFLEEAEDTFNVPYSVISFDEFNKYEEEISNENLKHFSYMYEDIYYIDNMLLYVTDQCNIIVKL